ncbi:unnamed protein product [Ascophyllum nodosum]
MEASADARFSQAMHGKGLRVTKMEGDGNCLFRSVADQVFGDPGRHPTASVRKLCVKHMKRHEGRFSLFHPGNFSKHLSNMGRLTVWGDDLEIR